MAIWNPWHGCHKKSTGCLNCYMFRRDSLYVTSDFFIEEADEWRKDIWNIIRTRQDLHFTIITKRIERFKSCIPNDWNDGYDNVTIICTCENQAMADERLPIFLELPIKHREIIEEPMLEQI
jgi:phage gp37Gp68 protein